MAQILLEPQKLGFVIATRAALAFGVGLLVAGKIPGERRRMIGSMLVAFGAATTVPAIRFIAKGAKSASALTDENCW